MISVEIVPYSPGWVGRFTDLAALLRGAADDRARHIAHIGSTAVPGLAAKPIIDIQICVDEFAPFPPLREAIESTGYRWWPDNDDRRKRYFTLEHDGRRVSNLHVRRVGEFSAQAALLFRDFLRAESYARMQYESEKRRLAAQQWPTIDDYADAKSDVVWSLMREADRWAWAEGWKAGPTEA